MYVWIVLTCLLLFEYWAINQKPNVSIIYFLQKRGWIERTIKISTQPGRWISLWLGWLGFGLMVLMNVYSIRKRTDWLKNRGKLSLWLNFHVFCGILGPTLILFHCGLKVRGLVGISFWSMMISFSSGVIGRYFFVQLSAQRNEFSKKATQALEKLNKTLEAYKITMAPEKKERILRINLLRVGGHSSQVQESAWASLYSSFAGDVRSLLTVPPIPSNWPPVAKASLLVYAINTRKAHSVHSFEMLMGYWHAFHFPFAIFMYIAAIIHIISSLVFLGA